MVAKCFCIKNTVASGLVLRVVISVFEEVGVCGGGVGGREVGHIIRIS